MPPYPWMTLLSNPAATFLALFAIISSAYARYNLKTCWGDPRTNQFCIDRIANGTWCFIPEIAAITATKTIIDECDEVAEHGSSDFTIVMRAHLKGNNSVAYYSGVGNTFLGGPDWPVPANPGIVRVCISGVGTVDGYALSACTNAAADNDWPLTAPYCVVQHIPPGLTDGCWTTPAYEVAASSESLASTPTLTASGGDCTRNCHTSDATGMAPIWILWTLSLVICTVPIVLSL
ncbi:hypothetical protein D9611_005196 [Ephemerocybe angulata]|uniref:Uncharacterized protein n=1 Tax=Ephemerocybe angulata TaxID=980116 RepID=A0A8H5C0F6_9AGAR|nr:hypothetical protein D9611_005196 [Tulosesus angulatus]